MARLSLGIITVRVVKVARSEKLGLKGGSGVSGCQELADEDEAIVEATYVPKEVPDAVAGALFCHDVVRQRK